MAKFLGETTSSKAHPDAERNKTFAKQWIKTHGVRSKPLEIAINAEGEIVWFYFWQKTSGNLAFPVSINQNVIEFQEALEMQYHRFHRMLRSWQFQMLVGCATKHGLISHPDGPTIAQKIPDE